MIVLRLASLSTLFLTTRLVALSWLASAAAIGQRAGTPVPDGIDNQAAVRKETCSYLDRNTTVKPEVWDGADLRDRDAS
jgi:hypothetical protein